eukprot:3263378-Rhodomonas_salina.1
MSYTGFPNRTAIALISAVDVLPMELARALTAHGIAPYSRPVPQISTAHGIASCSRPVPLTSAVPRMA